MRAPVSLTNGVVRNSACRSLMSMAGMTARRMKISWPWTRPCRRSRSVDPRAARVVELRFFGGLTEEDVAEVLSVSVITVKRDWKAARAWLVGRLQTL